MRLASEDRQRELVDAALRIVAERGIAALTTRALAEEVGLTSGALFRHFASLQALLEAVVTRVDEVLDGTYPATDRAPLERLDAFIAARSSAVGAQLGIMRLVLSEQFALALPAAASERLANCRIKTRSFVTACVREGQRDGSIRGDAEARALVPIVMGTIQMLALSTATPALRDAEAKSVRNTLLHLLRGPATPRKARKTR